MAAAPPDEPRLRGIGPRAPVALRLLRRVFALIGRLLGFRLELVGAEHLPRDGAGPPGRRLDRGRAART